MDKLYKNINIPNNAVERNLLGSEMEKEEYIDNAIELYEININEGFDGSHPYDRLSIIYRKQKRYKEEVRVLRKAIVVFESLSKTSPRLDVPKKLQKFREKLDRAIISNK